MCGHAHHLSKTGALLPATQWLLFFATFKVISLGWLLLLDSTLGSGNMLVYRQLSPLQLLYFNGGNRKLV